MSSHRTTSPPRLGVILLVVVVLLTLFAVVGLSFVLYAESEASASRIYRESQAITDDSADVDPAQLLNYALGQLIYDVRDDGEEMYSAMRGHSLARTMYGWNYQFTNPTVNGGVDPTTGVGFINGALNGTYMPNAGGPGVNGTGNNIAYNGLGPFKTLANTPPGLYPTMVTLAPGSTPTEDQLVNYTYYKDDRFLRDPERIYPRVDSGGTLARFTPPNPYAGGFNAPYTFPDRTSMFLSAVQANPSGAAPKVLRPSFFRPGLVYNPKKVLNSFDPNQYTDFWLGTTDRSVQNTQFSQFYSENAWVYKYLTLRPRPADMYYNYNDPNDPHNFPLPKDVGGDVTNLPGATGPYGGGSDSFWMDLNYPVQTARNGKKYKPLFAFLVMDLDGRVNVNVHGNVRSGPTNNPGHASNQGLGKHEVNLGAVLNYNTRKPPAEWTQLFSTGLPVARYSTDALPGSGVSTPTYPDMFPVVRPYLAPLDYDGVDDTQGNVVTRRFTFPPPAYHSFPTYNAGYDDLFTTASKSLNPFLYNSLSPSPYSSAGTGNPGDSPFSMKDNMPFLIGSATGTNYQRAALYSLIPQNLDTSVGRRFALTTHSYDLDTPGAMPWVIDPSKAPYQLSAGGLYPQGQTTGYGFTSPLSLIQTPAAGSDLTSDGRTNALSRLDLNRRLWSFYDPNTNYKVAVPASPTPPPFTTDTSLINDRFYRAWYERQMFAKDIFDRLVLATGATLQTTPGAPEFNALRYLAQLAVNVVDYIDEDDISTVFVWNPINPSDPLNVANFDPTQVGNRVVFGTEVPKLVVNEAYAEIKNNPADTDPLQGAQHDFTINFWLELYNPLGPATNPNGTPIFNPDLTSTSGQVNRAASQLQRTTTTAGTFGAYQIVIADEAQSPVSDLRKPDNTDGHATTPIPTATVSNYTAASGFTPSTGVDTNYVMPNNSVQKVQDGTNQGFYVLAPNDDVEGGGSITPTLKLAAGLTRTYPSAGADKQIPPIKHTILLRRLANPYLGPNPPVGSTTVDGTKPFNPYVTVDYLSGVPTNDAAKYLRGNGSKDASNPDYKGPDKRSSIGRHQPYTALNTGAAKGGGGGNVSAQQSKPAKSPQSTFFAANSINGDDPTGKFDWLVHLDRPLTSVAEVVNVSAFKPHELTQQFKDASGLFGHLAPWLPNMPGTSFAANPNAVPQARLFRALEYFAVGERNVPAAGSASAASGWISIGGRKAGMINVNTVWDQEILMALCDPQQNSNAFQQSDVATAWTTLQQRRAADLGGRGSDQPFLSLAAPIAPAPPQRQPSQYPQPNGAQATVANGTFNVAPAGNATQHPYMANELLTKISNHLTTRSNVFAVYLTVGFFEVMDDTTRPVKLGAEILTRSGAKVRHKMFAIVDRTNLAMDPTDQTITTGSPRLVQSAKRPLFWTALEGIPPGASTVTVTVAGGIPAGMQYDPSYDSTPAGIGSTAATTYLWVDLGRNQELAQVPAGGVSTNATTGVTTVQLKFMSPLDGMTPIQSKGHPGGVTLVNVLPGNPGPQSSLFDLVNTTRYKPVVPYFNIVQ
jgi:hypothetical protein